MIEWIQISVAASSAGIIIFLLVLSLRRCLEPNHRRNFSGADGETALGLQSGIAKLHHVSLHRQIDHLDSLKGTKPNYHVFRRGSSTRPLFNWADNPSLVTDAVENGWSQFAFTAQSSSSSSSSQSVRSGRASLLGSWAGGSDRVKPMTADVSWEICPGSADFMQKIRLNPGMKKTTNTASNLSVIKTALPLPGPSLGNPNSSFPQEAYFEITVLCSADGEKTKEGKGDSEKTKLIQENCKALENSEVVISVAGGNGSKKLEEMKVGGKEEAIVLSVGLTGGGCLPLKLPGSYPGSIGFNSNGSVYLDGMKLVFESDKEEWGRTTERVIGCGYNPSQGKVFFTLDSELVHVIHCKSEEFGTPLYPTLGANTDIMVLVNLGQSVFRYGQANLQRTPNPCFVAPLANSPALGYEDSKELFSMGRIDSQWLNITTTPNKGGTLCNHKGGGLDGDEESEGDFYEITLDISGRSPNTVL